MHVRGASYMHVRVGASYMHVRRCFICACEGGVLHMCM